MVTGTIEYQRRYRVEGDCVSRLVLDPFMGLVRRENKSLYVYRGKIKETF